MKRIKWVSLSIIAAFILTAAGCAHLGFTTAKASEEALRQRVSTEWEAKVGQDWGVVYDLAVESFKSKTTRNQLIKRATVNYREFSIKEVTITEPGRRAVALVDYSLNHMGFDFKGTSREEWLWENGDWYLDLTPTLKTPFNK